MLSELQALERDAVMGTYARQPVEFVRGEGTRLWDDEGHEYLDFLTGISVAQLGHCHPAVVEAVREQAGRLMHVGNLYYTEPAMRLAERLVELLAGRSRVLHQLGRRGDRVRAQARPPAPRRRRLRGARGRLPRAHDGRAVGHAAGVQAGAVRAAGARLQGRCRATTPRRSCGAVDERTAAVMIEPIQGEAGIHPIDRGLAARRARRLRRRTGALLIFDEIQCGMGRTRHALGLRSTWACSPDVMTVAKGLGGGLPIGACVSHAAPRGRASSPATTARRSPAGR